MGPTDITCKMTRTKPGIRIQQATCLRHTAHGKLCSHPLHPLLGFSSDSLPKRKATSCRKPSTLSQPPPTRTHSNLSRVLGPLWFVFLLRSLLPASSARAGGMTQGHLPWWQGSKPFRASHCKARARVTPGLQCKLSPRLGLSPEASSTNVRGPPESGQACHSQSLQHRPNCHQTAESPAQGARDPARLPAQTWTSPIWPPTMVFLRNKRKTRLEIALKKKKRGIIKHKEFLLC